MGNFSWVPLFAGICCSLVVFSTDFFFFFVGGFVVIFELLIEQNPVFSALAEYDTRVKVNEQL